MKINGAYCLYAGDARAITERARKPINPWEKLFNRIQEEAENGNFMLAFDEEKEGVRFDESAVDVEEQLEELGYTVSYSRVRDSDDYYGETRHVCYIIQWEE